MMDILAIIGGFIVIIFLIYIGAVAFGFVLGTKDVIKRKEHRIELVNDILQTCELSEENLISITPIFTKNNNRYHISGFNIIKEGGIKLYYELKQHGYGDIVEDSIHKISKSIMKKLQFKIGGKICEIGTYQKNWEGTKEYYHLDGYKLISRKKFNTQKPMKNTQEQETLKPLQLVYIELQLNWRNNMNMTLKQAIKVNGGDIIYPGFSKT